MRARGYGPRCQGLQLILPHAVPAHRAIVEGTEHCGLQPPVQRGPQPQTLHQHRKKPLFLGLLSDQAQGTGAFGGASGRLQGCTAGPKRPCERCSEA